MDSEVVERNERTEIAKRGSRVLESTEDIDSGVAGTVGEARAGRGEGDIWGDSVWSPLMVECSVLKCRNRRLGGWEKDAEG